MSDGRRSFLPSSQWILHRHVLALDVAAFAEAFAERGCRAGGAIERPTADKADHWQRWLLRARHERPRRSRAAEQRHELASSHCFESHSGSAAEMLHFLNNVARARHSL